MLSTHDRRRLLAAIRPRIEGGEGAGAVVAWLDEQGVAERTAWRLVAAVRKSLLMREAQLTNDVALNRLVLSHPAHQRATLFHEASITLLSEAMSDDPPDGAFSPLALHVWKAAAKLAEVALAHENALAKWSHVDRVAPALELHGAETRDYVAEHVTHGAHMFSTAQLLALVDAARSVLQERPDAAEERERRQGEQLSFAGLVANLTEEPGDAE